MKLTLKENYLESDKISVRLRYSIRRIIGKNCPFEELLNYATTLRKRIDGVHTKEELNKMLSEILLIKNFEKNYKKALTNIQ